MKSHPVIRTIESHTGGMPTRIVLEGAPTVPGASMGERFAWANANLHALRKFLILEPRGHSAMFGAILMSSTLADADFGVLFMSASGFLPMCGHGTIGLATVLVNKGLVKVTEPMTEVRLDTPAGRVVATVRVKAGRATDVTVTNVPSFVVARDAKFDVPGFGVLSVDVAFGGNFYAILDITQLGLDVKPSDLQLLTDLGLALIEATRRHVPVSHPTDAALAVLKAAILTKPAVLGQPARNLMVKEPRYFDRSPCGTGTSARMALEHDAGRLALGQIFVHESIIGTRFEGKLLEETKLGNTAAVVPQITGRAWITGAAEFSVDETDPFQNGFEI